MKEACERCGAPLREGDIRVCSYECTFCVACAQAMNRQCPNCGGTLASPQGAA
ncbi:MAG: DUF1272 domain-containing protein [Candidatus Eremiobacteraeota bacterium]|nr:DUF1272 domain-containing protein [Candidatus Eremiobacteraeota bacterium]